MQRVFGNCDAVDTSEYKISDEEIKDFRSEDKEKEDKKGKEPEHHYIGDDFNLDEFVDGIFKDADEDGNNDMNSSVKVLSSCELETTAAESRSSRDPWPVYLV